MDATPASRPHTPPEHVRALEAFRRYLALGCSITATAIEMRVHPDTVQRWFGLLRDHYTDEQGHRPRLVEVGYLVGFLDGANGGR